MRLLYLKTYVKRFDSLRNRSTEDYKAIWNGQQKNTKIKRRTNKLSFWYLGANYKYLQTNYSYK